MKIYDTNVVWINETKYYVSSPYKFTWVFKET